MKSVRKALKAAFLCTFVLSLCATVVRAQDFFAPIITADELVTLAGAEPVTILDIRNKASWGYDRGHIPDAVSSPYYDWRGGGGTDPLDPATLTPVFQAAGIAAEKPVIIIHSGLNRRSFGSAAWVYWILRSAGVERIAVLEGGYKSWREAGLDVEVGDVVAPPSSYAVELADTWRASIGDVRDVLEGKAEGRLLDSEAQVLLDSRVSDRQTLSDAAYIDSFSLFQSDGSSVGEMFRVLERLKNSPLDWQYTPVIIFSETRSLAALNWFMASEAAGITNVKLLPEPYKEWADLSATISSASDAERAAE